MTKIILLTGNFASGKTTISKLIQTRLGYTRVSGDEISHSKFPGDAVILMPDREDDYRRIVTCLLEKIGLNYRMGKPQIVDYVLFPEDLERLKDSYGDDIKIVALLPEASTAIARNGQRAHVYDSDVRRINEIQDRFDTDTSSSYGRIDTSGMIVEEVYEEVLRLTVTEVS